jgi:hypothetical protein
MQRIRLTLAMVWTVGARFLAQVFLSTNCRQFNSTGLPLNQHNAGAGLSKRRVQRSNAKYAVYWLREAGASTKSNTDFLAALVHRMCLCLQRTVHFGTQHFNSLRNATHKWLIHTSPTFLYAFFWIIPRCLNFICRRFGTLCSIFIGG